MKKLVMFLFVIAVAMAGFMAIQNFSGRMPFGSHSFGIEGEYFKYDMDTDTVYLSAGDIKGCEMSDRDAVLKCSSGDIRIPNAAGKIISVIDSKGIKSTYKAEFGLETLDRYAYNAEDTGIVLGKTFASNKSPLSTNAIGDEYIEINGCNTVNHVQLYGNQKKTQDNVLIAGSGGSVLHGGTGNDVDKLYGGKGIDTFFWGFPNGNDIVYNYTKDQDLIEMSNGPVESYRVIGNDVILRSGWGKLTIKDTKPEIIVVKEQVTSKKGTDWILRVNNSNGVTYSNDRVILDRKFRHGGNLQSFYLEDYADAPKDIDATNVGSQVYIEGDNRNNMIVAGRIDSWIDGMSGDDLIYAGQSRDVIFWGAGKGNDTVQGYEKRKDIIKLITREDKIDSYTIENGDTILRCGDATLTVKGVAPKDILVEDWSFTRDEEWRSKKSD